MAVVKRVGTSSRPATTVKAGPSNLVLPKKPNQPPGKLTDYSLFIYGEKGIGKSTLASMFSDSIINQFEPGRRNLKVFQVPDYSADPPPPPLDWATFKAYLALEMADKAVRVPIIDTVDRAYNSCLDYVCRGMGIKHPSEMNDYGKTWSDVKIEFETVMNSIRFGGKTPVFISHSRFKPVKNRLTGEEFELLCPTCSDAPWAYLKASCDFAFYYGYHGQERALTVRGNDLVWAACGTTDHFLDKETGRPLSAIPMGSTPDEGWHNLLSAFDNQLSGGYLCNDSSDDDDSAAEQEPEEPKRLPRRTRK